MAIAENSTVLTYLENFIKNLRIEEKLLYGSELEEDQKSLLTGQGYIEDFLNKVQSYISEGSVLILKNLEKIYPSLYDLFNQNYTKIGNKYFTKISLNGTKSTCEINEKERIILLVTNVQIEEKEIDLPLLNRFEKHKITASDLISEDEKIYFSQKIKELFSKITTYNKAKNKIKYNLSNLMVYKQDDIFLLIIKIINRLKKDHKEISNDIIKHELYKSMAQTFSKDVLAAIKFSGLEQEYPEDTKMIFDEYKKYRTQEKIYNLKSFIEQNKSDKAIIYTLSKVSDEFDLKGIEMKYETHLSTGIRAEKKIFQILDSFKRNLNEYLILKFPEEDIKKLSYLVSYISTNLKNAKKGKIDDKEKNASKIVKKVIFIIYKTRQYGTKDKYILEEYASNINQTFDIYFIDNLNGEPDNFEEVLGVNNLKQLCEITSSKNFENEFLNEDKLPQN